MEEEAEEGPRQDAASRKRAEKEKEDMNKAVTQPIVAKSREFC